MSKSLYKHIYRMDTLYAAWRKVRNSAVVSSSEKIRNEAKEFESRIPGALRDIQRALSRKEFVFAPQTGVAKTKENGKSRPIVLAPIPNRIVQRALLDTLHLKVKYVQQVFAVPTSYGGIPNKRVSMAIAAAKASMQAGAEYHIRSDIPDFFTKINKTRVVELIAEHVKCADTVKLFEHALQTDLGNLDALRRREIEKLFPIGVQGVAQGSPLSPLVANIYLHEFDLKMNSDGITCLRYIDDFLLLGQDSRAVDGAFGAALKELNTLALDAYSPLAAPEKASRGPAAKGVDFLGCTITPGLVQPSRKSRNKFRERVRSDLEVSIRMMKAGAKEGVTSSLGTYSGALQNLDRVILGWGKAFSFCHTTAQWAHSIDKDISEALDQFERETARLLKAADQATQRRIRGVRLLVEINSQQNDETMTSAI